MAEPTKKEVSDLSFLSEFMQLSLNNHARVEVLHQALRKALETELTPRQREVIEMRWFGGKRICEIAQELSLDPSTVCRTSKRAEQRLQRALQFYVEYINCGTMTER